MPQVSLLSKYDYTFRLYVHKSLTTYSTWYKTVKVIVVFCKPKDTMITVEVGASTTEDLFTQTDKTEYDFECPTTSTGQMTNPAGNP
jgi:hypothetical protein